MKAIEVIKKFFIFILDLLLAAIVFGFFVNITWYFAHSILDGVLVGNDSLFALGLIEWFAKFWPDSPKWFPGQGTGVSIFYSYPMFPTYVVIVISKISGLTFVQAYRLISFLIFPLTSLGIYFLTKRVSSSRIAGVFAGLFFLLSEASWVFLRLHGIFAQTFSLMFIAPVLYFFDKGIDNFLKQKNDLGARINWILASFFVALTFLAHPVTGLVVAVTVVIYSLFISGFVRPKTSFKNSLSRAFNTTAKVSIFVVLGIGLAAFWFFPFSSYNRLANRDGLNSMGLNQLKEVSLLPKTLIGFNDFASGDQRYDYFFFALPVLILFASSLIIGLIKNKKVFWFGLIAVGALIYTSLPLYLEFLVKPFRYIFTAVYFRALIIPFILLPTVAAAGLHDFWDLIFSFWRKFIKKAPVIFALNMITSIVVGGGIIITGIVAIYKLPHKPPDTLMKEKPAYGLNSFEAYGPSLDKDWQQAMVNPQLLFKIPKLTVSTTSLNITPHFAKLSDKESWNQFNRIDISPVVSGGNIVQNSENVSSVSIVNLYHFFASLIHSMWGYQAGVFFGRAPIYDNPKLLEELTKWYGIEKVLIDKNWDNPEKYISAGYEFDEDYIAENGVLVYSLYSYPKPTKIVELSQKPAVLVIGDYKKGAYEQVFRLANAGALPYDSVFIVEGKSKIDDYDLNTLKKFSAVILHGYSYKVRLKAWKLIKEYVESGGKVLVNTGWQYQGKEWGNQSGGQVQLPEPFPVRAVEWKTLDKAGWENTAVSDKLKGNYSITNFSPFSWRGEPWGLSVAKTTELRQGAEPLLTIDNQVLLAVSEFGKGKIIWSGFNFFAHIVEYRNKDEINFSESIFNYLLDFNKYQPLPVNIERNYPDKVEFIFPQGFSEPQWLMWKESFSPNWQLIDNKGKRIQLFRAGPGFMLANIPNSKQGAKYTLTYKLGFYDGFIAKSVTAVALIFSLAYIISGRKIEKIMGTKLAGFIKKRVQSITNVSQNEDSEY